jgi:hypothetical protein
MIQENIEIHATYDADSMEVEVKLANVKVAGTLHWVSLLML